MSRKKDLNKQVDNIIRWCIESLTAEDLKQCPVNVRLACLRELDRIKKQGPRAGSATPGPQVYSCPNDDHGPDLSHKPTM